jgi:hypothetical protein
MTHCTGIFGKQCTCGAWHGNGGMSVDHGWQSNHTDADEDDELRCSNVLASLFVVGAGIAFGAALIATAGYCLARYFLS